jgi:glycolate oxidase FAD binding subunit
VIETSNALEIRDVADIRDAVAAANGAKTTIAVRGSGSKAAIFSPVAADTEITLTGLNKIEDYDPAELVLTADAGARLVDIAALLDGHGQMLGFEPMDYGPLFGGDAGRATIGGIIAANCSGPRRFAAGAARDHFLGFEAVSGRGEIFKGGAKVVKNVTGYDLPKLLAGSWGTLAILTQVTLKVTPCPRGVATLVLTGLSDRDAAMVMAKAIGSTTAITGAAHLPSTRVAALPVASLAAAGTALTLLRVESYTSSVEPHVKALTAPLLPHRIETSLDAVATQMLWSYLRDVRPFDDGRQPLWRISVAPMQGWSVTDILTPLGAQWFYDWAGGLIWLALPETADVRDAEAVRSAVAKAGGHAVLVRAPAPLRNAVPAFAQETGALAMLSQRVKTAFDPAGVLNPGRFLAGGPVGSL